jgi:hypothetical protein
LCDTQRIAFRVGKQSIDTPGNVANMKRNRRQPEWPRIELLVTESCAPEVKVRARQFQCVDHRPLHGWNVGQCAAKPRLRFTHDAIIIGESLKKKVEKRLARLWEENTLSKRSVVQIVLKKSDL